MNNFFEGLKNKISTFCICANMYGVGNVWMLYIEQAGATLTEMTGGLLYNVCGLLTSNKIQYMLNPVHWDFWIQ